MWLMYILSVASAKCPLYGVCECPCKSQKLRKKDKCVAPVTTSTDILNTGLKITCVPSSLNSAETELSVILPYLVARMVLMSLGEVMLFLGKFIVAQGL